MTILTYNGNTIEQRDQDNWVNLTQMAKAHDARLDNWQQSPETQKYLEALQESISLNSSVLEVKGFGADKCTWAHPLAAIHFGQWISPEFHLWCNQHIKTLLETGKTEINRENPYDISEQKARIVKQKIEIAQQCADFWKELGLFDERDRLLLKDYTQNAVFSMEQNYLESSRTTYITISNRVTELGYKADLGMLTKIGKAIATEYRKLTGQQPPKHDQFVDGAIRKVNSYTNEDLPLVDRIIRNILGN